MFVEAVVFLAAIIGVLLAFGAFIFHMITRKPEEEPEDVEKLVDAAIDAALEEVNRTSQLVLDELNEKHNALLFLYSLMDDKQKEIEEGNGLPNGASYAAGPKDYAIDRSFATELDAGKAAILETGSGLDISIGDELDHIPLDELPEHDSFAAAEADLMAEAEVTADENTSAKVLPFVAKPALNPPRKVVAHPRYEAIKGLQTQGLTLPEIARKLEMGQGEVQLIIGLGGN